jgi:primary-amine oxidase
MAIPSQILLQERCLAALLPWLCLLGSGCAPQEQDVVARDPSPQTSKAPSEPPQKDALPQELQQEVVPIDKPPTGLPTPTPTPVATKNQAAEELQAPPIETEGNRIAWEGWTFNWQFRDIEGLVLTDVHFQGRKLLKYLGLAEIYVPYATGNPRPVDFALGGFRANPMPIDLARDCFAKGQCRALNRDGQPAKAPHADLMIHEEETGFAYAGAMGRAPGKMLVLWSMCHFPGPGDGVNNDGYTYVIRWKLANDGRIQAEVGATGGLQHLNISDDLTRGMIVGKDSSDEDVFAPSHVHNFYFRVDLDIDGAEGNVAQELNYENDAQNPMKSRVVWQSVDRERGRLFNEQTFRSWRVMNPKSLNAHGHPRSYQLMATANGAWRDGSDYWVLKPDILFTKYRANEFPYTTADSTRALIAIGNYMNEEPLVGEDIVVWYRVAFMHHPRSEDWPAQPIVWRGFDLIPRDFLDKSPLETVK